MPLSMTTTDLINEVRRNIDDWNTDSVTDEQIIAALNRAQRTAVNIMTKQYDAAFMTSTTTTTTAGTAEVDVPEAAYGGRVEFVEYLNSASIPYPVKRIKVQDGTYRETASGTSRPSAWAQVGRSIRLYPKPNAAYTIRIWYSRKPEKIVADLGRIVSIAGTTVEVDSLVTYNATTAPTGVEAQASGAEEHRLTCWVNIVDGQTGEIKGTYEVASLPGSENFTIEDTTLVRDSVLGNTVTKSLASDIAVDDIVCNVRGTGVPELYEAFNDFLVEDAAYTIKRAHGEADQSDYTAMDELRTEVERMWVGRESDIRVKRSSRRWSFGNARRRLLYS